MFKQFLRLFVLFTMLGVALLPFQNCGGLGGFEPNYSTTQASLELVQNPDVKDPPPIQRKPVPPSFEPVLADRYYLRSLLTDIFGPSALTVDSTQTYLNVVDHGTSCSLYRDQKTYSASTKTWVTARAMEVCARTSSKFLNGQTNPKPTITRQALLTRACSDLSSNDTTLKFALRKISSDGNPDPTPANARKLFHLFYRHHPSPHEGLLDSILLMLPTSNWGPKDWAVAVNSICASSHWQVL